MVTRMVIRFNHELVSEGRYTGNHAEVKDGLLIVSTKADEHATPTNVQHFPLCNIRSFGWKEI